MTKQYDTASAGRPPKDSPPARNRSIYISDELWHSIRERATQEHISIAALITAALRAYEDRP